MAPVLVASSNPQATIEFDGQSPQAFTIARCKEIGCKANVSADASNGRAPEVDSAFRLAPKP